MILYTLIILMILYTLARHTLFMLLSIFTVYSLHTATLSVHFMQLLYTITDYLKNGHYINTNICTHICRYTGNTVYILGTPVLIQHTAHTTLHNFTDITDIICDVVFLTIVTYCLHSILSNFTFQAMLLCVFLCLTLRSKSVFSVNGYA